MVAIRPVYDPPRLEVPNEHARPFSPGPNRLPRNREWPSLWRLLRRVPLGGLVLLVPVLLLLSPLLVMYTLARTARRFAGRIFRDSTPVCVHDPAVARLKTLRMWLAAAVTVVVLLGFGAPEDVGEVLSDRWNALLATPWLLMVSAPVVIVVVIRCASPERRPAMRAALRGPLRQLGCYVGSLVLVPGLIIGSVLAKPGAVGGSLGMWLVVGCVLVCAWAVFLFLFASAAVARTGFGTGAVHPTIPAVLTSVLVWEYAAVSGLPAGPPAIAYLLLVGGPATVTAVAWWEIHRLRTLHGVTLRGRSPETA